MAIFLEMIFQVDFEMNNHDNKQYYCIPTGYNYKGFRSKKKIM